MTTFSCTLCTKQQKKSRSHKPTNFKFNLRQEKKNLMKWFFEKLLVKVIEIQLCK